MTIQGALYSLNDAVRGMTYRPSLNWNSEASNVLDRAYAADISGRVGSKLSSLSEFDIMNFTISSATADNTTASTKLIRVRVHPANDAPVILYTGSLFYDRLLTEDQLSPKLLDTNTIYAIEDTPLEIVGVSVRDVDVSFDTMVEVTIRAIYGYVTIPYEDDIVKESLSDMKGNVGLHLLEGTGTMDTNMTFMGPVNVVNKVLETITFQPSSNYYGSGARLTIEINDRGNTGVGGIKVDTLTIRIAVQPRNDPPIVETSISQGLSSKSLFTLDEGSFIRIDGAYYKPAISTKAPGDIGQFDAASSDWTKTSDKSRIQASNIDNLFWQSGYELWRLEETVSYSTANNVTIGSGNFDWDTRAYADINVGYGNSGPRYFVEFNNFLYYTADDGIHGREIWRDEGVIQSAANIGLLKDGGSVASQFMDIMPGSGSSTPSYLQVFNGYLYFAADGIDTSWMVLPDHRDNCHSFKQSHVNPVVYFAVSEDNVWNPDRVYDCPQGYHWASTEEGYRHFTTMTDTSTERFWHSQSPAEIGERHGIQGYNYLGTYEQSTSIESPQHHEHKTYFDDCGWSSFDWGAKTRVHFRFSDSNKIGSYKHAGKPESYRPDLDSYPLTGELLTDHFAGIVCIAGNDDSCNTNDCKKDTSGSELWRTDGTVEGTERTDDIYEGAAGSNPAYLVNYNDTYMYFAATSSQQGRELWRTTGGISEAELVSSISHLNLGHGINPGIANSNPTELTVAGDYLFFAATHVYYGREVWVLRHHRDTVDSDYTLDVIDIVAGTDSSNPYGFESSGGSLPVYFVSDDGTNGFELWQSDGVTATLILDINSGASSSNPKYLTYFQGQLYFQADDGSHGRELWVSDGTAANTKLLRDIRLGQYDSGPSYFTKIVSTLDPSNEFLIFTATDGYAVTGKNIIEGYGGSQIWRTDGTEAGTYRVFQRSSNDLYIDRESIEMAFPARMAYYKHGLYLPASYGIHDMVMPEGGLRTANDAIIYGINQAIVVRDIDTPAGANMTVRLSVDKGVLVLPSKLEIGANSPSSLNILLVEQRDTDRIMIFNALTALGHVVEVALDGEEAYEAFINKRSLMDEYPTVESRGGGSKDQAFRSYDCVIMSLRFPGATNNSWDGFQAIRMIRYYESQLAEISSVPIIAVAKDRDIVNAESEALSAGADRFMYLKTTDYITNQDAVRPQGQETFVTAGIVMKEKVREMYDSFAQVVHKYLFQSSIGVNITSSSSEYLSMVELNSLPGVTVGDVVIIEGTVPQLNDALRYVYYFAPNDTNGDAILEVTVTDHPLPCTMSPAILPIKTLAYAPYALPEYPVTPQTYFNVENNGDSSNSIVDSKLCDDQQEQSTTAHIPLYISAVNQAPVIVLASDTMTAGPNGFTDIPKVYITDSDHNEGVILLDSFGFEQQPPISVKLSATYGRFSLLFKDEVTFVQGKGEKDRVIIIRGSIDKVNAVLSSTKYICVTADGCTSGTKDVITIFCDDEGFSGRGGALTATSKLKVTLF